MKELIIFLILINSVVQSYEFRGHLKILENDNAGQDFHSRDSLHCNVIEKLNLDTKTNTNIAHNTSRSNVFTFLKFTPEGDNCLTFSIRSPNEITIAISDAEKYEMFEFFIGIENYNESKIRRITDSKKFHDSQIYKTPGILSDSFHHTFWLSWYNGKIKFGKEGDLKPLMMWNETNMFDVKFIGIRTARSSGEWIFKEQTCPDKPVQNIKSNSDTILQTKCEKLTTFETSAEIRYQKNILEQMTLDFQTFKRIKSETPHINKKYFERILNELEENYSKAKVFHDKILLNSMINENEFNQYLETKIYQQIKTKFFEYFNSLNEINVNLPSTLLTTTIIGNQSYEKSENYEFINNPSLTKGCFQFNISSDSNNGINIIVKTESESNIEIFIGKTNSSITALCEHGQRVGSSIVHTENLKNNNKLSEFWLQWNDDGTINVGRFAENNEFISYKLNKSTVVNSIQLKLNYPGYVRGVIGAEICS